MTTHGSHRLLHSCRAPRQERSSHAETTVRAIVLAFSLLAAWLLLALPAVAQPRDPVRAREHLTQGYELKTRGQYSEALSHLLESVRLDPQLKTILNVADCEEQLLKFTAARRHWLLARDNASLQGNAEFLREAELRLAALERRMPQLTISFASAPPSRTRVTLDGDVVGDVSLGAPLPADPGKHVVVVQAPGHADQTFEIVLAEQERHLLQVAPGPGQGAAGTVPGSSADRTLAHDRRRKAQRIVAASVAGVGVVALGIATASFLHATSKHDEALQHCEKTCSEQAHDLQSDARASARIGNVSAVVAGVLIASGATLWLTTPKPRSPVAAGVRVSPLIGTGLGGLAASGAF
jgi:hypothetical protein